MTRFPFRLEVAIHLAILCWAVLGVGVSVMPGVAEPSPAVPSQGAEASTIGVQPVSLATGAVVAAPESSATLLSGADNAVSSTATGIKRPALLFASGFMIMALVLALRHRLSWLVPVRYVSRA